MIDVMIIVGVCVVVGLLTIIGILSRFRKCKSDQILVIYGKTGGNKSAKCVQGGAAFVFPVIQGYQYMSLSPLQFECNLQKALSSQNIRVDVPTTITVAISTEPDVMQNAAERLLGLDTNQLENLVKDIVYGQMRTIIADMTIEELNSDRDKFLAKAKSMIDAELRKLGLMLININITDIRDEAGYIIALGKKATATAINNAAVEIAKAEQLGAIQVAEQDKIKNSTVADTKRQEAIALADADRDRTISVATAGSERDSKVAEANKNRDVNVATAAAQGKIGGIEADKKVAVAAAELEVVRAEARGRMESADEVAKAEVEKNKENANKDAETARGLRNEAALIAEKIVPANIAKQEALINAEGYQLQIEKRAEANANMLRLEAEGAADAIKLKGLAEAEVTRVTGLAVAEAKEKSLLAEANGFEAMIKAAESNPAIAIQYKLVNQYKEIAAEQVKAFEHLQLGNVTIMDTSNGSGLTDFMKSLMSTVAPALNVMKSMEIPGVSKALQEKTDEFKPVK